MKLINLLRKLLVLYRISLPRGTMCQNQMSIPWLRSFLYDINHSINPKWIKSGSMICIQVESVKQRKSKGSKDTRWNLLAIVKGGKENSDPQTIQVGKKEIQ